MNEKQPAVSKPSIFRRLARLIPGLPACLLVCLALSGPAQAQEINASGGWNVTINASSLAAGSVESGPVAASISASYCLRILLAVQARPWKVDVHMEEGNWPGEFELSVKRTSPGADGSLLGLGLLGLLCSPTTAVVGGISYLPIGSNPTSFFSGDGSRTGIDVQFRLSGITAAVPAGIYSTTIVYTITAGN